jgi:restriction endonuclease Mrr
VLGFGPISSAPIGGLPIAFTAHFDIDEKATDLPIIKVASFFERALIERLHQSPDDLRLMDRRRFEELVAELFVGFGYEVELTKRTRDGGKDIIAIKRREVEVRFLIECKRPDTSNKIDIGTVRELYGVKCDDAASKAILATTGYFTRDAKLFFEKHRWELEPKDFESIKDWIAHYLKLQR